MGADVAPRNPWQVLRPFLAPALWSMLGLALVATGYAAWHLKSLRQLNADLAAIASGHDQAIDPATAPAALILARTNDLLRTDRLDEAQALAAVASPRLAPAENAKILFNLANYRLRQAAALVEKGDLDGATALVNLSKGEYRVALRLTPDDWDLKYNLDVAMRMVRDLPVGDSEPEEIPPDAPKRLWTDVPGVPKGLP